MSVDLHFLLFKITMIEGVNRAMDGHVFVRKIVQILYSVGYFDGSCKCSGLQMYQSFWIGF